MKINIHKASHSHGSHKHYSKEVETVDAVTVKENSKTVLVKLPDGNVIKRHRTKRISVI